ncbi:PTS transporter subunit EIIC [Alkalibacterium pelagium]|uniref:PTS system, sucrose-specific IIC component n=1 Tax=Alkalibacterium pelagium TaxID=426702 RepID=A0A1H7KI23_9LACT|nr:PTS transporter subunit EIIC [Alkalibacterium pelagium]GEN50761.1 PTS system EIIBC component [Alkalibacterium pelagium]SEK85635.1 PTS system, sucrose-specific IIC component [Alkalibacterium pelagium]
MVKNNETLIKEIVEAVGGTENINSATNCMTRLRMNIKDKSKIDQDTLKNTEGVMGVVDAETLQVVVGPGKAKKLADLLIETYNVPSSSDSSNNWQDNKQAVKDRQSQGKLKTALETIANIFIPMIPAIIAAGIFQGFSSLLGTMMGEGTISGEFWDGMRITFALIGNSFLGYFAIFTGVNAAKRFGATEALGGMIGAASIAAPLVELSTLVGLYDAEEPLNSILTTGKGGIIGVIFGVYILSKIERAVRKRVPDVLDLIVTPVITLLITVLLMAFIIMPLSGFASDFLVDALSVIIGSENMFVSVLSGYILAAVFLPMVLLGLHHGLIPIYAIQLEALGGVSLFPVLAMAGAGQVGAAIAIFIVAKKAKNQRLQQVISGALPAGILGIGEPLIYGVTLPLGKPFITAGLGAGFGGAYVMLMGVMANAWGPSGWVALPLMQGNGMLHYGIGILLSYVAGFIITFLFIKAKDIEHV